MLTQIETAYTLTIT